MPDILSEHLLDWNAHQSHSIHLDWQLWAEVDGIEKIKYITAVLGSTAETHSTSFLIFP